MFKQSISLVEFPKLYSILHEIEDLFKLKIYNYLVAEEFINEFNTDNQALSNSTIIVDKKDHSLLSIEKINKKKQQEDDKQVKRKSSWKKVKKKTFVNKYRKGVK